MKVPVSGEPRTPLRVEGPGGFSPRGFPLSISGLSMRVLFVTSEFADFAKTGGLADVSAALPRALREQGVDVRVLLPGYQKVIDNAGNIKVVASLPRRREIEPCLVGEAQTADGLPIYVLLSPSLYQREG